MKTLRYTLIALLILYGCGALYGAVLSICDQSKMMEMQHLGTMTLGIEKLLLLSGAMLLGQVWLYFSTIALLINDMKQGYMFAVTLGFIELIQAGVIIVSYHTHQFGSAMDYVALIKGLLLLGLALIAFKKSNEPQNNFRK
jgi:hypothetical protein